MQKKRIKLILAPIGVFFGITLFITLCTKLTIVLNIFTISDIIPIYNYLIIRLFGVFFFLFWFPIFITSIYYLGQKGAVGQSETLRTNGIYKHVRNPMYSGISFTIIGLGLIFNITGISLAGFVWLTITFIQCKREEKELVERFGEEYIQYKKSTPMYFPNFIKVVHNIIKSKEL